MTMMQKRLLLIVMLLYAVLELFSSGYSVYLKMSNLHFTSACKPLCSDLLSSRIVAVIVGRDYMLGWTDHLVLHGPDIFYIRAELHEHCCSEFFDCHTVQVHHASFLWFITSSFDEREPAV